MRTTGQPLPDGAFDDAGVQGVFNFAANQTASSTGTGGDPFASFLFGLVNTSSRTFNGTGISAKFGYNAGYAQTDWKIRPNLTKDGVLIVEASAEALAPSERMVPIEYNK